VVGESFEAQARQVFANVQAIVEAAGGSLSDVVKVTVFLADWQDFGTMNATYAEFFSQPYPARTPVQMAMPVGLIMVDAVAVLNFKEESE